MALDNTSTALEHARLAQAPRIGPAATGWPLCATLPPFPVEAPYRAKPDLVKLENAPLLHEDLQWREWIAEKERLQAAGGLVLVDDRIDQQALAELVHAIRRFFQGQLPNGPIDPAGGLPWLGAIRINDPRLFLEGLSLSLQEDFAIMADLDGSGLCAAVLSVCFPSGWNPHDKLGRSMHALHDPVADNQRLQQAMPAMSEAICTKGPFVRYVWTLTGDGGRARPPGVDSTRDLLSADQLWFRCERQITIPLMGKASLFLIRVLTAPFGQVITSSERLGRLAAALQSMSGEMVAYKHLARARDLVLAMQAAKGAGP